MFSLFIFLSFLHAQPLLSLERIRDILYQSHPDQKVRYDDMLGEGENFFDDDPRMNWNDVNCTTWWQHVIAKGYAKTDREEQLFLDRIRYYDGVIGFGTRKHFLDRALDLDPVPLRNIDTHNYLMCMPDQKKSVDLTLNAFTKNKRFSCPLYKPERIRSTFSYFSPNALLSCAPHLPSGVYVIFPVAMNRYIEVWGKQSGPMGRVHGLIFDKEDTYSQVYHASVLEKQIQSMTLLEYVSSGAAGLFEGYQIYMLEPVFPAIQKETIHHQQTVDCERKMRKASPNP
ncbi:MAG: hypothetical protein CL916_09420 [Deltaproteobacteria bacterium]|nr:hypothetical protein [Deltaproteobacteria bacterium]